MSYLPGRATPEGTEALAARRGPAAVASFRPLGRTGLLVSRVGAGTYRLDSPEHARALTGALEQGVNLIDTAPNYSANRAEIRVGESLRELVSRGVLGREEVVVVTKVGYLEGEDLARARALDPALPEHVVIAEDCWHCLHPDSLRASLAASRERLGLATVDCVLLHNPEWFLVQAERQGVSPDEARQELRRRLTAAFRALEEEVAAGRVAMYGASSNTLAAQSGAADHLDLEWLLQAARQGAGASHHFRVVEFPLNPLESRAALDPGDSRASLLARCMAEGLGVLVNRPLNALLPEGLLRLAEPPRFENAPELARALTRLRDLEDSARRSLPGWLDERGDRLPAPALSRVVEAALPRAASLERWREVERGVLLPTLRRTLAGLQRRAAPARRAELDRFLREYAEAAGTLALACAARAAEGNREALRRLDPHLPHGGRPAAERVLALITAVPGVDAVLNGMRHPDHVAQALAARAAAPVPDALCRLEAIRRSAALPRE